MVISPNGSVNEGDERSERESAKEEAEAEAEADRSEEGGEVVVTSVAEEEAFSSAAVGFGPARGRRLTISAVASSLAVGEAGGEGGVNIAELVCCGVLPTEGRHRKKEKKPRARGGE